MPSGEPRDLEESCDCGYRFGTDSPELSGMLAHQLTMGWIQAVSGGLLLVVGVALLVGELPGAFWCWIAAGGLIARGVRKIARSRHSLRAIAPAKLPGARVVR